MCDWGGTTSIRGILPKECRCQLVLLVSVEAISLTMRLATVYNYTLMFTFTCVCALLHCADGRGDLCVTFSFIVVHRAGAHRSLKQGNARDLEAFLNNYPYYQLLDGVHWHVCIQRKQFWYLAS